MPAILRKHRRFAGMARSYIKYDHFRAEEAGAMRPRRLSGRPRLQVSGRRSGGWPGQANPAPQQVLYIFGAGS